MVSKDAGEGEGVEDYDGEFGECFGGRAGGYAGVQGVGGDDDGGGMIAATSMQQSVSRGLITENRSSGASA